MPLVGRITWDTHEEQLREYTAVDVGEDLRLQLWLESAVEAADKYLGASTFDDENGDPIPYPSAIEVGVYEYVRVLRSILPASTSPGGGSAIAAGEITQVRTGDNSITFAPSSSQATAASLRSPQERALAAARSFWHPWKGDILLGI